ncbi:MAG: isoprenyl transferase [Planctomycetes bacterium]|nr:isoprenyl transferase [Planctomycetota bacterium]
MKRTPETLKRLHAAGLDPAKLPRHVAIIMDGNGRWAQERGKERVEGHFEGVKSVRRTIEECCRLGVEQLTLYCFSTENWKRPAEEINFLMALLKEYLIKERAEIMKENIRFRVIGRREELPDFVLTEMDENIRVSANNTGLTLCLAINYSGRTEIVDAVRSLAERARDGSLRPDDIDETAISESLYTTGMPEPDLLIRTAGEMRISNFFLWQISYAVLCVTEKCWPDFDEETLRQALRDFAMRERRFGGLTSV